MTKVPLSGQGVPLLGLGTWPLAGDEAVRSISMALELGFRHIDTAQMYGNEREVGRAVAASGLGRDEVFVATKVGRGNVGRARFMDSVAASLEQLGMAAVDLLLIHWPPASEDFDGALDRLAQAQARGLARLIGVSNFTVAMMRRAKERAPVVNNQIEFHPLLDQSKVKAEADRLGLTVSAYCPLLRGVALKEPVVIGIAQRLDRPPSEIVLRWIAQQGVAALPMTTKRANAESNLRIFDFSLSDQDMAAITALTSRNRRHVSPMGWAPRWDR